jgi:hypothetical protein
MYMLRSHLLAAGVAITAIVFAACSSDSETTPAGNTNSALPPPPGPQNPGDGPGAVLAFSQLYLGDTNRDGTPNVSNGWRQIGFNLDGKVSDAASTDLCQPTTGALKDKVYQDGDNGIDNSFGANILPIIRGLANNASELVNTAIDDGTFTIMFEMQKLGTGGDYNPLYTQLYGGSKLGSAPKWDGSDAWPVIPELLADPTKIEKSKIVFPNAYVVGNTWVSGDPSENTSVNLNLTLGGYEVVLKINKALIAVKMSDDHKSGTEGTLAGIIETEQFIGELGKIAGALADLCPGDPTFESIAGNLRQASDIMKDGSQNPGSTCDGISIGLGFDMKAVKLGAIGPEAMPGLDPCTDGTGGGGGAGGGA